MARAGASTTGKIPAGTSNIGDVDIASAPTGTSAVQVRITDGTTLANVQAASNALKVSDESSSGFGSAIPTTGNAIGLSDGTNLVLPRVFDADTGAGTQFVTGVNLRTPAAGGSVELGTATTPVRTDPTGTTTQPVSGTVTANAGTGPFPVSDNAGSLTIDGTVTANAGTGTFQVGDAGALINLDLAGDVQADVLTLPALVAGAANIGDVDVLTLPALVAGTANIGDVDVLTMPTTTVTGTVAHDAIDSGNPQKIGMKAAAHSANPTAVAAGDRTDWLANRAGIPWVMGGHPNIVTTRLNFTAAQTDVAVVTVAAGLKIVVTRVSVMMDNANTVDVQCRIGFGAVTTPTTTGVLLSHPGIAAGSGVIEGSGSGILGVGADGEDVRVTAEVPTTGSGDIVISYFTIES